MNGTTDTGGYDVEFADNSLSTSLEDIKCAICLLILKEPLQANPCGHRFCKTCIERVPGFGSLESEFICPSDRQNIKVFPDIGKEREILNLQVKCQSHEFACGWVGELRTLEGHLKSCPHAIFPCKYGPIGCKYEGNRQQMKNHLKDDIDDHFSLQTERTLRQEDTIAQHRIDIAQHQETIAHQNDVITGLLSEVKTMSVFFPRCPFTFTVDNFKTRFASAQQNNDFIYSDSFYYLNGYRGRLKLYLNGRNAVQGTHMSVYFQIMRGPFDDTLRWPMVFGLIKFSLVINEKCKHKMAINCKEDEEHLRTRFVKPARDEGEAYGTVKYYAHKDLPTDIHGDLIKLIVHVTQL